MPGLSDKVTAALQEVRILILGSEILLGFQFQAVFQSKFDSLPASARALDGLAFGLMLAAVILLISPGSFHRLAESGDDTARLHRLTTRLAALALLPFAVCIGLDEYIVAGKIVSPSAALAAGCLLKAAAFIAWYAIALVRRRGSRPIETEQIVRTSIKEKIRTLGTEIRVVLPGAQALLGFQFSAFLSDAFERLPGTAKAVHFASVTIMAITVILLMAPAAFHRIATGGEDTREVDVFGAYVMLAAMFCLALSMAGEFHVVLVMVSSSPAIPIVFPIGAVVAAYGLWFGWPLLARRRPVSIR
jgi:hypothetical protein